MGYLSKMREHINKLSKNDKRRFVDDYIKYTRIIRKIARGITENAR